MNSKYKIVWLLALVIVVLAAVLIFVDSDKSKIDDEVAVKDFAPGNDIKFEQTRGKDGKLAGFKLTRGKYSPFTQSEINNVNRMIDDITGARKISADEVLALDKKLGQYYNLIDDTAGPRPYHALVMKIKGVTEGMIASVLPLELRSAYTNYAKVQNLRSEFGNKLVDAQGVPKDTAPSFISNLMGKNKEVVQGKVRQYSDLLEMDLVREAQAIADAQKLHLTEAPSGGRVSDILKASLFGGGGGAIGAAVGGPVGAAVGVGVGQGVGRKLTSPRSVGTRAIEATLKKPK
ncbi:MAG TPA: hypothetical protein VI953_00305 [Candidatus Paceibacterota bacterium]